MSEKKSPKKDYLALVYNEKRRPKTDYPLKLAEQLIQKFKIKPNDKLLDVGCGRGEMFNAFSEFGIDCYGVDGAYSAAKANAKVELLDISKETFTYEDNSFDVVFLKSVIEHILDPSFMLFEIHRVLKPGGKFIVLTPDWYRGMKVFYEDATHIHPYLPQSIKDLLLLSGFKDVKAELFYHHPLIWKYSFYRCLSLLLQCFLSVRVVRKLTEITKIKFIRWSVERQVLGIGYK